ncbi:hypothetical protein [Altibacter sp. HG106]|uniref:hypothetical protein n=1 Tax=Altibacter sp. HG106 TaxID=3023937 RepID=UPI002350C4EE|nr:hypothetical protein [Altibacter sp. HG106]MDC7995976.1 hypothetical protein [Altibacter sp. HG106]
MNTNLWIPTLVILVLVSTISCIKDTDFEQASDITARPVVELNLIHFEVDAGEFYDESTNTSRLTLSDTTEIRFLDDSGLQESLLRAEFLFEFTNAIPRTFDVTFQFLSEATDTTYTTQTFVEAGTVGVPLVTTYEEVVEGAEILELTSANRVVVNVTIPEANAELEGALRLKSKTTYFLEITERE